MIIKVGESIRKVNSNLNRKAEKASKWYESNLLKGNLSKYQTMEIPSGIANGTDIPVCKQCKIIKLETLGVFSSAPNNMKVMVKF